MFTPSVRPETVLNALILHQPPSKGEGAFVVVDQWLADKLRPHQREGVSFIWSACMGRSGPLGRGCILADDMGLGKTLQTIAVIWTMLKQSPARGRKEGEFKSAMVVCPTSLVMNWAKEVKLWLGDRLSPIVVTSDSKKEEQAAKLGTFISASRSALLLCSYETLTGNIDLVKSSSIDFIVCDEAHRLKNPETKVFKQLYGLRSKARILVSGCAGGCGALEVARVPCIAV